MKESGAETPGGLLNGELHLARRAGELVVIYRPRGVFRGGPVLAVVALEGVERAELVCSTPHPVRADRRELVELYHDEDGALCAQRIKDRRRR